MSAWNNRLNYSAKYKMKTLSRYPHMCVTALDPETSQKALDAVCPWSKKLVEWMDATLGYHPLRIKSEYMGEMTMGLKFKELEHIDMFQKAVLRLDEERLREHSE